MSNVYTQTIYMPPQMSGHNIILYTLSKIKQLCLTTLILYKLVICRFTIIIEYSLEV